MKILDILNAGYSPVAFRNKLIVDYYVDNDLGVLSLNDIERDSVHISLEIDHINLPIEFELSIAFKEDIAAALLISGISPVTKDNVTLSRRFRNIRGRRRNEWESEKEAALDRKYVTESSNLF